jgi:hypothetical protein
MLTPEKRDRPTESEIKVTPSMEDAGACEVLNYNPEANEPEDIARAVYLAMEMERLRAARAASEAVE